MELADIDHLDRQILHKLAEDGKTPYTEIAKQLFVSSGTIHVRMKKMEQMGIVTGSGIIIDYEKLGYKLSAFIGVFLENSTLYTPVATQLKTIPEIIEIYHVGGPFNMLAKALCRDVSHLSTVLCENIEKIPGIQRVETIIALAEDLKRPVNFLESSDETHA